MIEAPSASLRVGRQAIPRPIASRINAKIAFVAVPCPAMILADQLNGSAMTAGLPAAVQQLRESLAEHEGLELQHRIEQPQAGQRQLQPPPDIGGYPAFVVHHADAAQPSGPVQNF